jgi:predicted amidohydrolase
MNLNNYLNVAAFQGSVIEKNPEKALEKVCQVMQVAQSQQVDILCMPESYLHGYLKSKEEALQFSIDLRSAEFDKICSKFERFSHTTLLLGLNEREGSDLFNTVVVIEQGKCLGKYRKAYTYPPYDYFSLGRNFPVFEKKGIKYGIIICLDSAYREPAHITSLKGARILFCPSFNRVGEKEKMLHYLKRKSHFIARAFDNHCWFVNSDIIWDENDDQICPGYACILNDEGELVTASEPFVENLLTYSIPINNLLERKYKRLFGTKDLYNIANEAYLDKQHLERDKLYEETVKLTIDTTETVDVENDVNKIVKELG